MKVIQSTCNYCAIDCNLDFHVKDNRIVKVVPKKGYPVNDGLACIKGLSLDKQQTVIKTSPRPKIKQEDGTMKEVSWDEGFSFVAEKILELQEKYGKESVAGISTGQLTMEEFALYGHIMRNFLQTNVDGNTRLCMATAAVAHNQSFGYDAPGFTLKDIELSDTIILVGSNLVVAHPVIWDRLIKNKKETDRLIVIDPRKSETAEHADYHYALKSSSDLALMYTLANLLIEKDYIKKDFIDKYTNNFDEFKEFVKDFTLERGVRETGLTEDEILELVELIHTGKKVSFWWTMGINQGYDAVRSAQSIINLALMTGNIGRPGTGANSITGQCNAMSSRLFSNTTALFGGGAFDNPTRRERVANVLGVDESFLAKGPTKTYNQIIEGINAGDIKGLWIVCTNPRHSWANNETFRTAMEKLELFVVQDIYDSTESAEGATVFLPAVSGIKKEGTYINLERRISPMRPCITRGEDELSDYEIFLGVGKALGMGEVLNKWETPKDAFNLMREMTRGMPSDFTGVTWEGLENSNGVQWPLKEGEKLEEDERRLYEDGKFFTENKKANFIFEEPRDNPLPTCEDFPYVFNTGRGTVGQWHTQSRTKEVRFIEDVSIRDAYVLIDPKLAEELKVENNEMVRIYSANGEDAEFIAKISDKQRYGEIYAPIHYVECNKLTASIYDPYSKEPSYKSTPVRIEKA